MGRKNRSHHPRKSPTDPFEEPTDIGWMEFGGTRMFVVGWTPGGVPYGVTEEEMARADESDDIDP